MILDVITIIRNMVKIINLWLSLSVTRLEC
jgi:hypothetical protein